MYIVSTNEIAIILIVYTIILVYVLWDRKYNHLESKMELDDINIKSSIETITKYDDNKYRRMIRARDVIKSDNGNLNNMSLKHLSLTTKLSELAKTITNSIKLDKEDIPLYLRVLDFKNNLKTIVVEDDILDILVDGYTEILNIIPLSFNNMRETVFMDEKHIRRRSILANPDYSVELRGTHKPSYNNTNYILFIKCVNRQVFGLHLCLDIKNNILKIYSTRYINTENNWYTAIDTLSYDKLLQLLDNDIYSNANRIDYIKTSSSKNVRRVNVLDIDNDDSTLIPISIHISNSSL